MTAAGSWAEVVPKNRWFYGNPGIAAARAAPANPRQVHPGSAAVGLGGDCSEILAEWPVLAVPRLRSLYLSPGTRETRKPRLPFQNPGTLLARIADRQISGGLFQPPPRITRDEPLVGPVGSSSGDLA